MSELGNLDANGVGRYDDPHNTVGLSFAQLLNLALKSVSDALTTLKNLIKAGDSGWITVSAFSNSWGHGSVDVAYRKLNGVVYLRGVISGGSSGAAFTLPAGYRPGESSTWDVRATGDTSSVPRRVIIGTNGVLQAISGTTPSLAAITFIADN